MHAFDVLGDPVRRRILELIADAGDVGVASRAGVSAGAIGEVVQAEFGISQPAVSRHLRVLRESGFATVAIDGQRRLYAVDTTGLDEIDRWLTRYRRFWPQRLDALDTELRRGSPRRTKERS